MDPIQGTRTHPFNPSVFRLVANWDEWPAPHKYCYQPETPGTIAHLTTPQVLSSGVHFDIMTLVVLTVKR